MLYPDIAVDRWCEIYDLTIKTRPCSKCGIPQTTLIPWAAGDWRGLVAPKHGCGDEYELSTAISVNKDERNEWKKMVTLIVNQD